MNRPGRGEQGQTTVLIVGFFIVAVLLVVVVVDASAAYLRRQRLDSLADGAALAATEGVQEEEIYTHGVGERLALDPATARADVVTYLRSIGAYTGYRGLSIRVVATGDAVQVEVSAPLELPLVPDGWTRSTRVTGRAASYGEVDD